MNVIEYVTEEVTRQGHDVTKRDGLERVGWMLDAWSYALKESETARAPEIYDAIRIGRLMEPEQNAGGIRKWDVTVGGICTPSPERVLDLLEVLWKQREVLTSIEFYQSFELVHPFLDGNGRSGKVLLNWLEGTLLNPIFPPSDLWGRPIRNP